MSLNDQGHSVELANINENLALGKNAIQSSTYDRNSVASNAVDGSKLGTARQGCSSTKAVAPSWWAVDLGQETSIGRVRLTRRPDGYPEQLQTFFIGTTNVSPWVVAPQLNNNNQTSICKYFFGYLPVGLPLNIYCEPDTLPGRYVFVYIQHAHSLTICEFEAYYK